MGYEFYKRKTNHNRQDGNFQATESRQTSLPNSLVMRMTQDAEAEENQEKEEINEFSRTDPIHEFPLSGKK